MILSTVDVWRVEVDIIKMHLSKQKLREFQRFIGTFQIIYYNNQNQGYSESFFYPGLTPRHLKYCQTALIAGVLISYLLI